MPTLNIKNEEAYRLIRELADREGRSMTAVVIDAVREKLDREHQVKVNEERVQYFLEMDRRVREATDPECLAKDPTDDLYDESGLPT